jgi:hypothetical protein
METHVRRIREDELPALLALYRLARATRRVLAKQPANPRQVDALDAAGGLITHGFRRR